MQRLNLFGLFGEIFETPLFILEILGVLIWWTILGIFNLPAGKGAYCAYGVG